MRTEIAFDDVAVPSWPDTVSSNPIPVATASTKLFVDVKLTISKGDGAEIYLEYSPKARDYWSVVSDLGGAPAPGVNTVYPFTYRFTEAGSWLIAIPQHLVAQGDYRLVMRQVGSALITASVTAYLKTGEY